MASKKDPIPTILATSAAGLYVQFGAQLAVGLALASRYRPTLSESHPSLAALRAESLGRFLADFHYWGSALLVATSGLHLALMLWFGWYRKPHQIRWLASVVFFLGSVGLQITGNLLPMDRHAVQTVVIEAGIAGRLPFFGPAVRQQMLGGTMFGQPTLDLWFRLHQIALPLLIVGMGVAAFFVHLKRKDAKENRILMLVPAAAAGALAFVFSAPFGSAATEQDFSRFDAQVGWYTLPMHGLLRMFESVNPSLGWVGAALVPALLVLFLLALPFVQPKLPAARIVALALGGLLGGAAVGFGGRPAPIVGVQEPIAPRIPTLVERKASPIDIALSKRGRELFSVSGCSGCHGHDGAKGEGGPDLTRIHESHVDPAWYLKFIRDPQSVKPGSTMPAFADTPEDELRAMAEFLRDPNRTSR